VCDFTLKLQFNDMQALVTELTQSIPLVCVMCRTSFRVVLVPGLFFVRIISSLANSCINTSEGMRNCDVRVQVGSTHQESKGGTL